MTKSTSKNKSYSVYRGIVLLDTDDNHIASRRAMGDTDASLDVRAVFSPHYIAATHKCERMAMEQLASEIHAIADSIAAVAKRLP
jgi:hypothetical protein